MDCNNQLGLCIVITTMETSVVRRLVVEQMEKRDHHEGSIPVVVKNVSQ